MGTILNVENINVYYGSILLIIPAYAKCSRFQITLILKVKRAKRFIFILQ